jgi:hypothetical protein
MLGVAASPFKVLIFHRGLIAPYEFRVVMNTLISVTIRFRSSR